MNAAEFKTCVLNWLHRLDEAEMEETVNDRGNADRFTGLYERWLHARAAFPGMSWKDFIALDHRRKHPPRRGRRPADPGAKANTAMFRAARDVDRIKDIWRDLKPAGSRKPPPVSPIEIAAERHKVAEAALGEIVRRPLSRRYDRRVSRP